MKLFFDTETTGLADFRAPIDAPSQPRLVQLAAILTTDDLQEISAVNLRVRPDGFVIPAQAAGVHGVTTEMATATGIRGGAALEVFIALAQPASVLVAFNFDYDRIVMGNEFAKCGFAQSIFELRPGFCAMKPMTNVCRLPGARGYKWPKLQEAYQHCFGKPFEKAHDALADVRATIAVYGWYQKNCVAKPNP